VRLVRPGAYRPDRLIRGLEPALADPERKLAGFHVFTFNDVAATEAWRRDRLDRLTAKLGLEEGSDVTARV
jgi:methylenetetrahydrofolate reductase (NADPH)